MRFLSLLILISCFFTLTQLFASGQESADQEGEQIEIARRFVDRLFADPGEDAWHDFQLSEGMKTYLPSDTFRKWAKDIVDFYGKPDKPEKIEVVQRENGQHDVSLFCHCHRYPIEMRITFDGTTITGFHWESWKEESEKQRKETEASIVTMTMFFVFGLPILCFLIIFIGEALRTRSVKRHQEYLKQFDFDPSAEEIYRESQNPAWCHVLLLVIWACCLVPLAFIPAFLATETVFISIILAVVFLPLFLIFGFFFTVDRKEIVVRMGFLRIPIRRISLDSILTVETKEFRPLMDFGGWGIRSGWKNTVAYFMSGNRGVLVTTSKNKKYLLGSDTPEQLAEVIQSRLPDCD